MLRKKAKQAAQAPDATPRKANPYVANARSDDDRYMNLSVSASNWRKAWQLTFALLVLSVTFNGYHMSQNKFVPYVVAYDKLGHIITVGRADQARPVDSVRVVRATVAKWIEAARIVTGDQLTQKRFINDVYARVTVTGKAKKMLDEYYRERNIWETAQKFSISAEITLLLKNPGDTYQVEWTETTRNIQGDIIKTERWKALLAYEITPLDTEEGIMKNPEGLFITDFNWSKQI